MQHTIVARGAALALGGLFSLGFETALADVTIEERLTVEGTGMMSFGNMTGSTVRSISGDRAREDNEIQMQSRLVRLFAHGAGSHTAQLILLDEDRVDMLDLEKRQYTETSLAQKRAEMQKALDQAGEASAKQPQPQPTAMDESQCDWSEPTIEAGETGQTARIAGFDAREATITASQSCTDRKSGAVCEVAMWVDMWLAPDFAGSDEVRRFDEAYARKMGFTGPASRELTQRVESLFSRYKGAWEQASQRMQGMKGYPVRTTFALGMGGARCRSAQDSGTASSADAASAQASSVSAPSAADVQQAAAENAGQTAGESAAAHTGFGALAGRLGGAFAGGLFAHHKSASASASVASSSSAAPSDPLTARGLIVPLRYTLELVSVRSDAVSADTFAVPAGFRKVDTLH